MLFGIIPEEDGKMMQKPWIIKLEQMYPKNVPVELMTFIHVGGSSVPGQILQGNSRSKSGDNHQGFIWRDCQVSISIVSQQTLVVLDTTRSITLKTRPRNGRSLVSVSLP